MSMRVRRIGIVAVAMAAVNVALLITEVCARHYRVQVKSLGLEPSGLSPRPVQNCPLSLCGWQSRSLMTPESVSRDPFEVECKVHDRWVQIENRAGITAGAFKTKYRS